MGINNIYPVAPATPDAPEFTEQEVSDAKAEIVACIAGTVKNVPEALLKVRVVLGRADVRHSDVQGWFNTVLTEADDIANKCNAAILANPDILQATLKTDVIALCTGYTVNINTYVTTKSAALGGYSQWKTSVTGV